MRRTLFVLACSGVSLLAQKVDFEKQVQPLLAQRCFACHGEEVQQSGLRLDKRQNAMRGGDYGPVIIPGKSAESKLIRRVVNGDGGMQMPPTGPLSTEEIATLKAWIDQGAEYRAALKAEAPVKPVDPRVTALVASVRAGKLRGLTPELMNAGDEFGSTALHHAAAFGSIADMKTLLDAGANVNAKNKRASTPLHWAIRDEAKVRLLLEHGAVVDAKQADGRTPLYQAAQLGNGTSILRLLLEKSADPNIATSNGQTPLAAASGRGNVEAMRLLIAKKAVIDARSGTGATALMAAAGSREPRAVELLIANGADVNALTKRNESSLANAATTGDEASIKLLLEHGAKVNVADDRGYSPLMYAAASETMNAGAVKLLLAKGADVNATGEEETARTLAAKRGDTEIARLLGVTESLRKAGGVPEAEAPAPARPLSESVGKALGLLAKQSDRFIHTAGCNSCHSQDLPSAAAGLARDRGMPAPVQIVQLSESMNGESAERILDLVAANVTSISWEMFDRALNHAPRDQYSDATVYYLKANQTAEGNWKSTDGRRPPMQSGDIPTTALAVFALKNYSPAREQAETDQAIARARGWLERAQPTTTQERSFQLLGLTWSGADKATGGKAAGALAAAQRGDGGWNQLAGMGTDAFATGEALYALNASGSMPVTDPVYKKGVQYLVRGQGEDGSWHVKSRSIRVQPYFDSGFPYEHDQWISAAGTAWASMALSLAANPNQRIDTVRK